MGSSPSVFLKQNNILLFGFLVILVLCCIPDRSKHSPNLSFTRTPPRLDSSDVLSSLKKLNLDGHFDFEDINQAAKDFGNRYHFLPSAVLHPKSASDISSTIKLIYNKDSTTSLTVAARGHGHSLEGQAQAHQGVVINMESLQQPKIHVRTEELPYVDVSGGELWINILHETLKYGLSPKSWTDYLHMTVGGTLSNAGISGQAFRHGPQINNVYEMEVVTGKGEVLNCSDKKNADLFYGVLGGLGQFGIITRARISLGPAKKRVMWIRVLYSEFTSFSKDQEHLISSVSTFDYIEGFVIINRTGLLNNWRSYFNPKDPIQASEFSSEGKILYCLEMAKYFDPVETDLNKNIERLLTKLNFIPSTLFLSEVSYVEFLDRVHQSEIKLRAKGLWEIPHPWLNLLIPQSRIQHFAKEVFGNILTDNSNGPILIYPVNKSKWNNRTSMVTPDEDIMYLVAFLSSAVPSSTGKDGLEHIINQNQRIIDLCSKENLGCKQYLPHYRTQEEWKAHFGNQWETYVQRKSAYDPLAILAPGQRIFQKAEPIL